MLNIIGIKFLNNGLAIINKRVTCYKVFLLITSSDLSLTDMDFITLFVSSVKK